MQGGCGRGCLNHSPGDLGKCLQISSPSMKQCFECKEHHTVPREIVNLVLMNDGKRK